jgi:hypothetical protein
MVGWEVWCLFVERDEMARSVEALGFADSSFLQQLIRGRHSIVLNWGYIHLRSSQSAVVCAKVELTSQLFPETTSVRISAMPLLD